MTQERIIADDYLSDGVGICAQCKARIPPFATYLSLFIHKQIVYGHGNEIHLGREANERLFCDRKCLTDFISVHGPFFTGVNADA